MYRASRPLGIRTEETLFYCTKEKTNATGNRPKHSVSRCVNLKLAPMGTGGGLTGLALMVYMLWASLGMIGQAPTCVAESFEPLLVSAIAHRPNAGKSLRLEIVES